MFMLPASVVVTCPSLRWRRLSIWSLLLIASLSIAGDVIWTRLGEPRVMVGVLAADAQLDRLLAVFWTASIGIRIACLTLLACSSVIVASRSRLGVEAQHPADRSAVQRHLPT